MAEEEAAPHNRSGMVRAATVMRPLSGRLLVGVTFDPSRGYARRYLPRAKSLGGLRRKIETLLLPDPGPGAVAPSSFLHSV